MATMPCLANIPVPYADKLLQDLEEAGVALKEHHSKINYKTESD